MSRRPSTRLSDKDVDAIRIHAKSRLRDGGPGATRRLMRTRLRCSNGSPTRRSRMPSRVSYRMAARKCWDSYCRLSGQIVWRPGNRQHRGDGGECSGELVRMRRGSRLTSTTRRRGRWACPAAQGQRRRRDGVRAFIHETLGRR